MTFLHLRISRANNKTAGFTLLEIMLSMTVLALLAGAIYAISSGAVSATRETLTEQLMVRRVKGFLDITRDAFLNLPATGSVYLNPPSSSDGNALPDLCFENATDVFGIPSLGGGTLVLSALPRNDGTRTFSILRLPKNVQEADRSHLSEDEHWIKLLPKVTKPHWSFFRNGDWIDEWPYGSGRPQLVRLQMEVGGINNLIEAIFYIPTVSSVGLNLMNPSQNNIPPQTNPPSTNGIANPPQSIPSISPSGGPNTPPLH